MSSLTLPNIAITTNPSHALSITEVPTPSPSAGECLIHVTATGICGSDVHFWKHGGIGSSKVTGELGLGHESAGEIVEVGEGVEGWKIGMFVSSHSPGLGDGGLVEFWCTRWMSRSGAKRTCALLESASLLLCRKDALIHTSVPIVHTKPSRTSYTTADTHFSFSRRPSGS